MNPLGKHLILELYDCDSAVLNDAELIEKYMTEAALACGATIVSTHINRFNPHGISGVIVIAESHLTIHTWPEHCYAAVDAFTCGELLDTMKVKEVLEKRLNAKRSLVKELVRGIVAPSQAVEL